MTASAWAETGEIVVVDTETTGLGRSARLVEIAALLVRRGRVVDTYETLVDPLMPIPSAATMVHGITDSMVHGKPRAKPVLESFLAFTAGRPLVAHNAAFDRGILGGEFERAQMALPGLEMYCTLKLARRVFPTAPNHRLDTLVRLLGIRRNVAHRALADARATAGIVSACITERNEPLRTIHGAPKVF